jgi:DNA-binding transcriptional regulator GbsR (MarR family)
MREQKRAKLIASAASQSAYPVVSSILMAKSPNAGGSIASDLEPDAQQLIREFVGHWGLMARAWGINSTMGELFALLYITGTDWTADDLRQWLGVSRGNVSMNLRELLAWGVVHKVHRSGERRELFRAETEVWTLFRKILTERKRRELDPSLSVLDRASWLAERDPALEHVGARIEPLRRFFRMIDGLAVRLIAASAGDLAAVDQMLAHDECNSGTTVDRGPNE